MSEIGARAKELKALGFGVNDAGTQAWWEHWRSQLANATTLAEVREATCELFDRLHPPLDEYGRPRRW